jgi:hypothetical protein
MNRSFKTIFIINIILITNKVYPSGRSSPSTLWEEEKVQKELQANLLIWMILHIILSDRYQTA